MRALDRADVGYGTKACLNGRRALPKGWRGDSGTVSRGWSRLLPVLSDQAHYRRTM